MTDWT